MPLTQEAIKQLTVDDLLNRIIEESAEIIQAASKFKRFGFDNYNPFISMAPLNIESLGMEYMQLKGFVDELFSRYPDHSLTACYGANLRAARNQEEKYVELGIPPGV